MNSSDARMGSSWPAEARQVAGDLAEFLSLRRDLAELEIGHDAQVFKRFAIGGGMGLLLAVIGVPVLVICLSHGLAAWSDLPVWPWMLLLGGASLLTGTCVFWLAYRRLRGDLCGLQGTLAELREDLVWLREWTHGDKATSGGEPAGDRD